MKCLIAIALSLVTFAAKAESPRRTHTAEIRSKMVANMKGFKSCYEKALRQQPNLAGKVVLKWTISEDGTVKAAEVKESELKTPTAESCLIEKLQAIKFLPPDAGVESDVTYPLIFRPQKPK